MRSARPTSLLGIALIAFASMARGGSDDVKGYLLGTLTKMQSVADQFVHDAAQYLTWMRESGTRVFIDNKLTPAERLRAIEFILREYKEATGKTRLACASA